MMEATELRSAGRNEGVIYSMEPGLHVYRDGRVQKYGPCSQNTDHITGKFHFMKGNSVQDHLKLTIYTQYRL